MQILTGRFVKGKLPIMLNRPPLLQSRKYLDNQSACLIFSNIARVKVLQRASSRLRPIGINDHSLKWHEQFCQVVS